MGWNRAIIIALSIIWQGISLVFPPELAIPFILIGLTVLVWAIWPDWLRHQINRLPPKARAPLLEFIDAAEAKLRQENKIAKSGPPPPLTHWFKNDFDNTLKLKKTFHFEWKDGQKASFEFQVYYDFDANAYFLGSYIPNTPLTFSISEMIANDYEALKAELDKEMIFEGAHPTQPMRASENMRFTHHIYIYHTVELTDRQRADLRDTFGARDLSVDFRGRDWQSIQWMRDRNKG